MNKLFAICILALVVSSTFAQDENCVDHPWIKRGIFAKFLKIWKVLGKAAEPTEFAPLVELFKKDANTAKADQTLTAADFAGWPTGWDETKTCCTKANYDLLLTVPTKLIELFKEAHSPYLRQLSMIPKLLGKCSDRKPPKGTDGKERPDPKKLSLVDLLKKIKDGDKSGIEYLKKFFEHKAKALKAWIQFTRGNAAFLCRLPSKAKLAFADATAGTGALKVNQDALTALQTTLDASLAGTKEVVDELFEFAKIALEKIGGEKCKAKFDEINAKRKETKACPQKADGTEECKSQGRIKPLDLSLIKPWLGKIMAGEKIDIKEKPDDAPTTTATATTAATTGTRLRHLQADNEADSTEAAAEGSTDANAVGSIAVASDDAISFGGVKADGTTETGADFTPSAEAFNSDGKLIDSDGKVIEAEVSATTTADASASGSSVVLAFGLGLLALIIA